MSAGHFFVILHSASPRQGRDRQDVACASLLKDAGVEIGIPRQQNLRLLEPSPPAMGRTRENAARSWLPTGQTNRRRRSWSLPKRKAVQNHTVRCASRSIFKLRVASIQLPWTRRQQTSRALSARSATAAIASNLSAISDGISPAGIYDTSS